MTPQLVILMGIPGVGKSTWAGRQTWSMRAIVVSSDEIRGQLRAGQASDDHARVFDFVRARIRNALAEERNVIVDATNVYRPGRLALGQVGQEAAAELSLVRFDDVVGGWERNRRREPDVRVPEPAMAKMIARYFDALTTLGVEGYDSIERAG